MRVRSLAFAPTKCGCLWFQQAITPVSACAMPCRRPGSREPEKMSKKKKADDGRTIIADNRKARHAYSIESTLEAGLVLVGSEVKSLRTGKATIGESYAQAKDGELFLANAYIPEYLHASRLNHQPRRPRKLLVRQSAVRRPSASIQR